MKKITLFTGLALMFALALPVYAQDTAGDTSSVATDSTTAELEDAGVSTEAIQDEIVTEEDLGAKTPGRFHFLKTITRTVRKAITTDPIKKAQFDIEEAHEDLLLAKKLAEGNPDDAKVQEKVQNALQKFENKIEDVKNRAQDIKEKKADQAGAFMEKIADMQVKQQKMLDNLEQKLPEQAFEKVRQARENALQHASEILTLVAENKEQLTQSVNAAMEKQVGSDFKDFKNMEVMDRLREHMPENFQNAMDNAQTQARVRFEEAIQNLNQADRGDDFKRYMQNVNGVVINQMRVLDGIKSQADVPEDFLGNIEQAKEKAMNRFEEQMRKFENPDNQELMLSKLGNGNLEDLRMLEQIKDNIPEDLRAQIQQKESESVAKFKEKFIDDPDAQKTAERFQELSRQMRENPDPTTFALIQNLKDSLPPAQKSFVQSLGDEASRGFAEKIQADKETFLRRIESFDPGAIENLQNFRTNAPQAIQAYLGEAVSRQIDFTKERIENAEDPAAFERIKQTLDENPEIQRQIQQRHFDFSETLNQKEGEINDIRNQINEQFKVRLDQENQMRQQEGKPDLSEEEAQNLQQRNLLRPQAPNNEKIDELKRQFEQNIQSGRPDPGFRPDDMKRPPQSGENQGFDPKQFEPGDRGDARSQEMQNRNQALPPQQQLESGSRAPEDMPLQDIKSGINNAQQNIKNQIQQRQPDNEDDRRAPEDAPRPSQQLQQQQVPPQTNINNQNNPPPGGFTAPR